MKKTLNVFLLSAFLLVAFSCKPKENMVYMENQTSNVDAEVKQAIFEGAHLQSGDLLDIKVTAFDDYAVRPFNLSTMNQAGATSNVQQNQTSQNVPDGYLVSNEGTIIFPVLGIIHVENLTMSQLRSNLEKKLLEYLSDPLVTIRQLNFNVTVLGAVKSPGRYTNPSDKLTIFQALGMAGDLTDGGERTKVKLLRNTDGVIQTHMLDLTNSNITSSPFYYIQQNDVLYVEPDINNQITAGVNPNRNLLFQIGGVALGVISPTKSHKALGISVLACLI